MRYTRHSIHKQDHRMNKQKERKERSSHAAQKSTHTCTKPIPVGSPLPRIEKKTKETKEIELYSFPPPRLRASSTFPRSRRERRERRKRRKLKPSLQLPFHKQRGPLVPTVHVLFIHGGMVFEWSLAALEDDGDELADLRVGVVGVVDMCGRL